MNESAVAEGQAFLEHFGVKGMQWGVRRARKREAKASIKTWRQSAKTGEQATAVYNEAAKTFGPVLKKINKEYPDIAFNPRARQEYDAVVQTLFNQHLGQASITKANAPGTDRVMLYQMTPDGLHMRARETRVVVEGIND